ncbi:MAG: beta-lactamase family protein [Nocardioidaceae bacterium]|nr:beta-lactamase family protein [Nocardioidaceae bacterium]NUS50765.1 beta-lactamase family protein [Nocardioidaceae bacterium]
MSLTDLAARRLDVLLAEEQTRGRLPSVVGGVVRDGSLVWSGAVSGLDGFAPDSRTQYRIGSITKTLVAVAVLQLRDEGALDLNDPLSAHLGDVPYADRTLRDLLAHASGMHAEPPGSWWERSPGATFDEVVAALDDSAPAFPAGATFHYTNVAFALLGEVVARHRGMPWFDVVRARLLGPLGMHRTTYLPEKPHATGWSVHHHAGTLTPEPAHDAGAMAPAGQVWSTVEDLGRYAAFLVSGRDGVLSRATLDEMATPQSGAHASGLGSAHGLGFQLVRGGSGMLHGHTGSMPGFLAGLFVDPVRRTGVAVLANGTVGLRADGLPRDLLETLERTEGSTPEPWRPNRDVPAQVTEVLGMWHWGNTALSFGWNGREVVVTNPVRAAESYRFAPQDDGTFLGTRGYHHGERLHVVRNDDGTVNHLVCETFVYTRVPYDPAAPIPGGHP